MSYKEQKLKEVKERFGQFAILGSLGRVYNGALDNNVGVRDIEDFISKIITDLEQDKEKALREQRELMIDKINRLVSLDITSAETEGEELMFESCKKRIIKIIKETI